MCSRWVCFDNYYATCPSIISQYQQKALGDGGGNEECWIIVLQRVVSVFVSSRLSHYPRYNNGFVFELLAV